LPAEQAIFATRTSFDALKQLTFASYYGEKVSHAAKSLANVRVAKIACSTGK